MSTQTILLTILVIILALVLILCIRAIMMRSDSTGLEKRKMIRLAPEDRKRAVQSLSVLVRVQTVSDKDPDKVDWKAFERFIYSLDQLFPLLSRTCKRNFVGETGMIYTWKGKSDENPILLTAHYDVVPPGEGWSEEPFSGSVKNKRIWGRGTLDTKGSLCAILNAAELLICSDFVPEHTIYFAFSGEEEIAGASASQMADWFEEKNIRPAMVLDEGGAVVDGMFPGVHDPIAMIGVCEKGQAEIRYTASARGGHASSPGKQTSVTLLADAISRMNDHPLPCHFTPVVRRMFDILGPHASFSYRLIYANLWFFSPIIRRQAGKTGGNFGALFRTTQAVTMLEASDTINVLPHEASCMADMRILPGSSAAEDVAWFKNKCLPEGVEAEIIENRPPGKVSPASGRPWEVLSEIVQDTWKDVIACPYMMTARSDARCYEKISDRVYRFTPYRLSPEQLASIHGKDEYLTYEQFFTAINFYYRLMKEF